MKKYLVLAGVLLTAILLLAATYNTNLLPATTGLDLGSPTQQWDGFFQNVTMYGNLNYSGAGTVNANKIVGTSITSVYGNSGKLIQCTGTLSAGQLLTTDGNGNCLDATQIPSGTSVVTDLIFYNSLGSWTWTWDSTSVSIVQPATGALFQLTTNSDSFLNANDNHALLFNYGFGTGGVKFYDGQNSPSLVATVDNTGKGSFNGGIKAGSSGSTISDTRALVQSVYSCGTTNTCANTANGSMRIVTGTVALASASPSAVTVTAINPAFTSASSYNCTATPEGNTAAVAAGGIALTKVSGSSFTLTGPNTVTTVVDYICIGN